MLLLLVGCAKPVEAPTDLDGLFHWFLANYDTGTDEEMLAAAANFEPLVAGASRGTVSVLTDAEQATVELDVRGNPAEATGMFVAGPVACTFPDYERVHYVLDQKGIYEAATGDDMYIEYSRAYTSDLAAYEAREAAFLTWETNYTVKPVFTEYSAVIQGSIRYVPAVDGVGPLVVSRAILPSPATFTVETEDAFEQDYQLDVMLPSGDGSIHGYVAWRDLTNAGLTDESAGVQNLMLDGFEDFDRDTELVCAAGGF